MKHYTEAVKNILASRGYSFIKVTDCYVYYITPNNQLVKFEDCDLILFELFGDID